MKIAIIGDCHFGCGDIEFLEKSQLRFFREQLIPYCRENGVDTLVFEGDIFHNRKTLDILVKNKVLYLFVKDLKEFTCHIYLGNHDVYYKNSNSVHSLKILSGLPNVTVYEEITEISLGHRKILMVPWLYDLGALPLFMKSKDPKEVDLVFGHFDIIGAKMSSQKFSEVGLAKDVIFQFPLVFSGHYHSHSEEIHAQGKLVYTGTPYQMDRGDKRDTKGFFVMNLDDLTYEFLENVISAKFLEVTYPAPLEVPGNNKIDVFVEEKDLDSFEFREYLEGINKTSPLSVTVKVIDKELGSSEGEVEIDNKSLEEIFIEYVGSLGYDGEVSAGIVSLASELMRDNDL